MTTAILRSASPTSVKADAVVIGVHTSGETLAPAVGATTVADAFGKNFGETLAAVGASGKPGDVCKLISNGAAKAPVVVVVGLGERDAGGESAGLDGSARSDGASSGSVESGSDGGTASLETLRRAAGAALRALSGKKTVALALPARTEAEVTAVAQGALLGGYGYDRYLAKKHEPVGEVVVLTDLARSKGGKNALAEAVTIADAVNLARDLVNAPPNDLYPESFATEAKQRAKGSPVTVSVLDERTLESKGYGGILGVGQGSIRQPRLVKLSYKPAKPVAHLAFVGKGITFDSGGLSIKPANSMVTMKCDMSGAAAVVGATYAIADLGLPVRITTYACLAENMPSGTAIRPGDVLTMYGGKTVEVLNTDAEGRLVLADGISTANGDKPDLIVDVATLTGACVVALGQKMSGVFSNEDALREELVGVAERAGEDMWPLPIPDEMKDKVHTTKIADLSQHNPEAWGGASYAAAFLREFVGEGIAWAHLDIAGPAFNDGSPYGYTPKGGTGTAVRTLVQLAIERAR